MRETNSPGSLRASLDYEPRPLKFGTSGRRGEVVQLTQLEVYINASAELEYLRSLPVAGGGIVRGDDFYLACDLRPSSTRFVPEQGGRGEIAQAIVRAVQDAGMRPVYLGQIPTPALTCYALRHGKGSMMITGSHIPFDRNGYKTNSSKGELLKKDEVPIDRLVETVRHRLYAQSSTDSIFNSRGLLKTGSANLPPEHGGARQDYLRRYLEFMGKECLRGLRLLVYQHSAVGRDLLVDILTQLGAEVFPVGRSESFVPIDTENIDAAQLATVAQLAHESWNAHGPFDAVVSTDGDSDRPLILGVEPSGAAGSPCQVKFYGGDLVGMVVAEYLGADAVVVPISCNDAIDRGPLSQFLEPKTKIGSPYVIAGMEKAGDKGRNAICGWEANGGFLTGSDIVRADRSLSALPTRDAMLPIVCVLASMREGQMSMGALFDRLPKRFSKAALLRNFPRATSMRIVERFSPSRAQVKEAIFDPKGVYLQDENGNPLSFDLASEMRQIRATLAEFFSSADGFGEIVRLNYTDGVRIYFGSGDVAHVRPSGNADELRVYAVADTQARADAIAALGVAEPEGILRRLERG